MRLLVILFNACIIVACNGSTVKEKQNSILLQDTITSIEAEIKQIQNLFLFEKNEFSDDDVKKIHSEYMKSEHFEIRVASSLYVTLEEIPDDLYDSYLEKQKYYRDLIKKMFFFDQKILNNIESIDQNSLIYLEELRYSVKEMYEQYNGLESKEFYTLLAIKDSFLIDIISDYLINNEVDSLERVSVIMDIQKYYPSLLD